MLNIVQILMVSALLLYYLIMLDNLKEMNTYNKLNLSVMNYKKNLFHSYGVLTVINHNYKIDLKCVQKEPPVL